jgi:hypothetical protein
MTASPSADWRCPALSMPLTSSDGHHVRINDMHAGQIGDSQRSAGARLA